MSAAGFGSETPATLFGANPTVLLGELAGASPAPEIAAPIEAPTVDGLVRPSQPELDAMRYKGMVATWSAYRTFLHLAGEGVRDWRHTAEGNPTRTRALKMLVATAVGSFPYLNFGGEPLAGFAQAFVERHGLPQGVSIATFLGASALVELGFTLPVAYSNREKKHATTKEEVETPEVLKARHATAVIQSGTSGGAFVAKAHKFGPKDALLYGVGAYMATYALPLSTLGVINENAARLVDNPSLWLGVAAIMGVRVFDNVMGYESWTEKGFRKLFKGAQKLGHFIMRQATNATQSVMRQTTDVQQRLRWFAMQLSDELHPKLPAYDYLPKSRNLEGGTKPALQQEAQSS
ncbi:MAG TPA: hypothetical protein VGG13_01805 [Candidatus Saccharimonadales bacterium]|jgi:hypothetical protein